MNNLSIFNKSEGEREKRETESEGESKGREGKGKGREGGRAGGRGKPRSLTVTVPKRAENTRRRGREWKAEALRALEERLIVTEGSEGAVEREKGKQNEGLKKRKKKEMEGWEKGRKM